MDWKRATGLLLAIGLILPAIAVFGAKRASGSGQAQAHAALRRSSLRDGDLIFQTSRSRQSAAIRIATGSSLTHCGIIYRQGGRWFVYEAVQPVKLTPLDAWIARGENGRFAIRRLKNSDALLTPAVLLAMKKEGERFRGKDYDLTFDWSDERIYCSELIWKIYQRGAGVEIGALQKLRDFRIEDPRLRTILKERYGGTIPLDEQVISPQAVFESAGLETVFSNM